MDRNDCATVAPSDVCAHVSLRASLSLRSCFLIDFVKKNGMRRIQEKIMQFLNGESNRDSIFKKLGIKGGGGKK